MKKEQCQKCMPVFPTVKEDHPEWTAEMRNTCVITALREVNQENGCGKLRCIPLMLALREQYELRIESNPKPPPLRPPDDVKRPFEIQADEVVENHIKDQVFGHPDKYTAYSHKKNCGCPDSQRTYKDWKDLYEGKE
jgi:hypothetical protein